MKVKVNKDACIGCGLCVATAPDTFGFDDEGKAEVVGDVADEASVEGAVGSCPVGAIEEE